MRKNYTIRQFRAQFPDEKACLSHVFKLRFEGLNTCPNCFEKTNFRRVFTRKCYQCTKCYHQIHPCAGTIFHKSRTPLTLWFYAMFLFTASKNGLSACELERQIGVTNKTAWRMLKQIRSLFKEDSKLFEGVVEIDETFIGGKNKNRHRDKKVKYSKGRGFPDKASVMGILNRKGNVAAYHVQDVKALTLVPLIVNKVKQGTTVNTDEWCAYSKLCCYRYKHVMVEHGKGQYVQGSTYTNGIENFWSIVKRTINGSYIHVSKKYLQLYVNEVVFRFNNRKNPAIFHSLLSYLDV